MRDAPSVFDAKVSPQRSFGRSSQVPLPENSEKWRESCSNLAPTLRKGNPFLFPRRSRARLPLKGRSALGIGVTRSLGLRSLSPRLAKGQEECV